MYVCRRLILRETPTRHEYLWAYFTRVFKSSGRIRYRCDGRWLDDKFNDNKLVEGIIAKIEQLNCLEASWEGIYLSVSDLLNSFDGRSFRLVINGTT